MKHSKTKYKYNKFSIPNPKLEDCPVNKDMSITINSSEGEYPLMDANVRHYMYLIKKYIMPYVEIKELYPELSPTGRLHYHGTVRFKTIKQIVDWYFLRHKIGGVNISLDLIKDKDVWDKYIRKQHSYMKPHCKPYRLTPRVLGKYKGSTGIIKEMLIKVFL